MPRVAEIRLLLACALAPRGTDLTGVFASTCHSPASLAFLWASAAGHKLRPQFAAPLLANPEQMRHGTDAAADLEATLRAIRGRGKFLAGELVRILGALRAVGILAVPFKGPAFAALLGDAPESREMSDLDLLVQPADVARAAATLSSVGYAAPLPLHALASPWLIRITPELPLHGPRDATLLELHWAASPRWYPAPCTVDDVMRSVKEARLFDHPVQWPAPEELFLLHVADGMKSCGRGIRWIADAAKILRHHSDLEWHHVRNVAASNGGLNSVRVALAAIEQISSDVARELAIPAIAVRLPAPARTLAGEAWAVPRLANAVRSIHANLNSGDFFAGPTAHFLWALSLSDRPARTAGALVRYLSGPTINDLALTPGRGESDLGLRLRSLRRRLGRLAA